jgi:peptidoglycan/LPS O-acetylase OafA/YrhL
MQTPADRFPLFDSLRALAALSVVFFHGVYQQALLDGAGKDLWRFGGNLDVGVPIFFGISGFLLYRPFVKARADGRSLPSLRRYGLRRVLRIVPAFWVALTVVTIWFDAIDTRSLEGFVRYYLFLQVYDPDTAVRIVGQAWSLNVEVVFYALLPVWAWWMFRRQLSVRGELIGLAVLFAASLAWQVFALSHASPADPRDVTWLLVFPNWVDHLAIGMALAVLSVRGGQPGWFGRTRLLWAAAFALWLACSQVEGGGAIVSGEAYFMRHALYSAVVFCLLGAPEPRGGVDRDRLLLAVPHPRLRRGPDDPVVEPPARRPRVDPVDGADPRRVAAAGGRRLLPGGATVHPPGIVPAHGAGARGAVSVRAAGA